MKPRGLGRGLDALLGGGVDNAADESLRQIPIHALQPGKYQPRSHMDADALTQLAASIRAQGVVQPIVVRPIDDDRYEILAGERRWRAAQQAGLNEVPALIRDVPDQNALAIALIENIQREDLNPLEEATGLQRLIKEFDLTHQAAAEAIGRSRSAATNMLRLLQLAPEVQAYLINGQLDMGHARALLALPRTAQLELAAQVVRRKLTVRETERLVHKYAQPTPVAKSVAPDRDIARLQEQLADKFGAKVTLRHSSRGTGKLIIEYATLDHLDAILKHL